MDEEESKHTYPSSNASLRFFQLGLRLIALAATLAAAIIMIRDKQSLSIFGVHFIAKYTYSPAFTFFVVANGVACGYAFFSVPISLLIKPNSGATTKFLLLLLDLVMVALVMAGASAATAIAYIGENGNSHTRWSPICNPFDSFCDHVGGALVASFIAVILFFLLTLMSTYALYKHRR